MASPHPLGRRPPPGRALLCWAWSCRRALGCAALHAAGLALLVRWAWSSGSLALRAQAWLCALGLLALLGGLAAPRPPGPRYSFGLARLAPLAAFSSAALAQLGALLLLKEAAQRLLRGPGEPVPAGRLPSAALLGLLCNLCSRLCAPDPALAALCRLARTGWLQEHVADLSRSLCGLLPGLGPLLLPRLNPFLLLDLSGALALLLAYLLLEQAEGYQGADVAAAALIAMLTCATTYPLAIYSAKVLLQTRPPHAAGPLDKLLREVSTLDGVLEVRSEHFWALGLSSMAGSVHVRIRRDANEQLVLAHVTHRLRPVVATLTVQIFKDDWTRPPLAPGAGHSHAMNLPDHYVINMPKSSADLNPTTSTPAKLSSPPPEFSFNTPGRNMNPVILPSAQARPYAPGFNYAFAQYGSTFNPNFRTGLANVPNRFGTNSPGQYN